MSENEDAKESSGLLANALISKGLFKERDYLNKIAKEKREMGKIELAEEYEKKAKLAESQAILMKPSPLLTDEENKQYIYLLNQRYTVDADGEVIQKKVSPEDKHQLEELVHKAFPEEAK